MTSLPMPTDWTEAGPPAPATGLTGATAISPVPRAAVVHPDVANLAEDERFLFEAFRCFAQAAGSLERSYGGLRSEVERLRRELELSNSDLARSLETNRGMRAHLDRILEALPCGVLVVSAAGAISRTNPEALRLIGMDGKGNREGNSESDFSTLPEAIRQLLESARNQAGERELPVPNESGPTRWLAARHASLLGSGNGNDSDSANGASASVFILRDVSERKRLEAAQDQLRRDQALAEMSAVLAHEIRNPLGSLELFTGLLAESGLEGECRKWIEHVQAGLRTLAATVNNVLHFHSLPEPERAPLDLGQLLDWACAFLAPVARQSRIELACENHLAGVPLAADRHRLEQVLLNLVLNAVRAMPGGGWIKIAGCRTQGGRAVSIVVGDTGPGIAVADLPRIFEPGFSTRAGSPGLGLAVCRKIVEQHGGTIAAASRPGSGARFTLTFPLGERRDGEPTEGAAA